MGKLSVKHSEQRGWFRDWALGDGQIRRSREQDDRVLQGKAFVSVNLIKRSVLSCATRALVCTWRTMRNLDTYTIPFQRRTLVSTKTWKKLLGPCGNERNSLTQSHQVESLKCKKNCSQSFRRTPRSLMKARLTLYTKSHNLFRRNRQWRCLMNLSRTHRTRNIVNSFFWTRGRTGPRWRNQNGTSCLTCSPHRRIGNVPPTKHEMRQRKKSYAVRKRYPCHTLRRQVVQTWKTCTTQSRLNMHNDTRHFLEGNVLIIKHV